MFDTRLAPPSRATTPVNTAGESIRTPDSWHSSTTLQYGSFWRRKSGDEPSRRLLSRTSPPTENCLPIINQPAAFVWCLSADVKVVRQAGLSPICLLRLEVPDDLAAVVPAADGVGGVQFTR